MKEGVLVQTGLLAASILGLASVCVADDPENAPAAASAPPTLTAPPPISAPPAKRTAATITRIASEEKPAPAVPGSPPPAKFAADAKWEIAGYNNEEIVYSILVTNQDSRIIHCNAELHGFYFENGEKLSISDRQSSTIFPGKQVNVGHWMGMDQNSGATYKVDCRPL